MLLICTSTLGPARCQVRVECISVLPAYWRIAFDIVAEMLVDRNNKIFPLGELTAIFYANYVSKLFFVLSTNMAAMQTTHRWSATNP